MNKKGFTLIELMIVIAIIAILAAILVPNFLRARAQGQYTACASNLRNVATALEMYATDHTGRYPADLGDIKPDYLRQVPECPSAGDDTFTDAYSSDSNPDEFTVYCGGDTSNHDTVSADGNWPQFSTINGLQKPSKGEEVEEGGGGE